MKAYLLEAFIDELRCPICQEYLRDPMLTKECLHRFCARCIQREVANGLRHCPKCRRLLPNKVPFKSDPNFASIVNKMNIYKKTFQYKDMMETVGQYDPTQKRVLGNCINDSELADKIQGASETVTNETNGRNEINLRNFNESQSQDSKPTGSHSVAYHHTATLQNWAEKQRLNRENKTPLILWPDGSIFRDNNLPKALRHPRYIYVPYETTVAHLSEYLFQRCKLECKWNKQNDYCVEFARVEYEHDQFTLLMRDAGKVDHLKLGDNNGNNYTLALKNDNEMPSIMFSIAHPFRSISETLRIADILSNSDVSTGINDNDRQYCSAPSQNLPPKLIFRFMRN